MKKTVFMGIFLITMIFLLLSIADAAINKENEGEYRRNIQEEQETKHQTRGMLVERYYKHGEQLYRQGNFKEAILQFEKVLKLSHDYEKTEKYISKCKKKQKKQELQSQREGTERLLERLKKEGLPYAGEKIEIDHPLSLKGCIEVALDNSIELKKALKEADGRKAEFNYTRLLFTPELVMGFETYSEERIEDVTSTRNRSRLFLNQSIHDPYKQHKVLAAKTRFIAAKKRRTLTKDKVVYNVAKAYFGYLKSQRTEESFKKMVKIAKNRLDIVDSLYKGGLALQVDLLKSEEILLTAEEDHSFAQANLLYAKAYLNQVMGLAPSIHLEIKDDVVIDTSGVSLEELDRLEYENHPLYRKLEEKIGIAEHDVRFKPAQLHPRVDIGVDHVLFGNDFPTDKGFTEFLFTVKIPIFAYLETITTGPQKEDLLDALELEKVQLQRELSSKAGSIFLEYLKAKRKLAITGKRLKWSEEQFRSLQSLYKFGDESKLAIGMGKEGSKALAVLDAQLTMLNTKRENLEAEYDLYINTVRLREALGQKPQDWLQESINGDGT